jgi:hypothetical protein
MEKKSASRKSVSEKSHSNRKSHELLVTIERRRTPDRRSKEEHQAKKGPVVVDRHILQRRAKVNRRRQIDPTTCERDYTPDEVEFMGALDEYKRLNGRMFPTCSEVLEVLKKLGYERRPTMNGIVLPADALAVSATPDLTVV